MYNTLARGPARAARAEPAAGEPQVPASAGRGQPIGQPEPPGPARLQLYLYLSSTNRGRLYCMPYCKFTLYWFTLYCTNLAHACAWC